MGTLINALHTASATSRQRVLLFLLPALSLSLITYYFWDTDIDCLPIAIVDNDHSNLSSKIVEIIDATHSVSIDYSTTEHTAQQLIKQGKIYAAVIIPQGFERDILSGNRVAVALYNSGTNISTNGFITRAVQSAITTFGAAIDLQKGIDLEHIMPTRVATHILFNPTLDYAAYLAPCFMAMMIMIFTLLATVIAITEERISRFKQLILKCLPITLIMMLFALVMLCLLFLVLDVPLQGSRVVIILAAIMLVIDYQAVAVFIVALLRSRMLALSVGGGYCVLAFTFSGLTFPTMAMSPILGALSHIFPLTYYLDIFIDQALRGAPIELSAARLAAMTLFALLPATIYKRL